MAVNEPDEPLSPADRRIAALYRQAADEEAPAHLDARLMTAARQGLAPRAAAPRARWWSAWRVPFAVAAVAVVSVSLVTLVIDEGGDRLTSAESPSTAPRPDSAPPPAAEAQTEAPAKLAAADPPARVQPPARDERAPACSAPVEERGIAVSPPPAVGPSAQDSERRAAARDTPRTLQKAPAEATAAKEAAPAPAPAAAPAAPPAPAAAAAPRPDAALRRQEMGSAASRARALPEVERLIAELDGRAPPAWFDRIAGLRRDGRTAEADGLVAEFTRRFPDEAVPPGLRDGER